MWLLKFPFVLIWAVIKFCILVTILTSITILLGKGIGMPLATIIMCVITFILL